MPRNDVLNSVTGYPATEIEARLQVMKTIFAAHSSLDQRQTVALALTRLHRPVAIHFASGVSELPPIFLDTDLSDRRQIVVKSSMSRITLQRAIQCGWAFCRQCSSL